MSNNLKKEKASTNHVIAEYREFVQTKLELCLVKFHNKHVKSRLNELTVVTYIAKCVGQLFTIADWKWISRINIC